MSNQNPMLRIKDRENIREPDFISPKQLAKEMDDLARHYGTDSSKANLEETKKILSRGKSLIDELREMRDENI